MYTENQYLREYSLLENVTGQSIYLISVEKECSIERD